MPSSDERRPKSKHPAKPQEEVGATSGETHDAIVERTLGRERAHHVDSPSKPARVVRDGEE